MAIEFNDMTAFGTPLTAEEKRQVGKDAPLKVRPYLSLWGKPEPTPLLSLPSLARRAGVAQVYIKNEAMRLGLGSFKALGGAYAAMVLFQRLLQDRLGRKVAVEELRSPEARDFASSVTVCCATDGNHGKSVAAGARLLGCRSVIFVHAGVSQPRIAALGADEIVRVQGSYDFSVSESERMSREQGWLLVSDMSWPGYEEIPALVAQGYTVLAEEALRQIAEMGQKVPTHVFLQAGVGGLASSVAGFLSETLGREKMRTVVVEPERAACLFASARRRELTTIEAGEPTVMAMLECHTPSLVAWNMLAKFADAFMTVTEEEAMAAMRLLAFPPDGEPAVVAGESGVAGLAGLLALAGNVPARERLGLGKDSRVLIVNSETATDPESYERIVGASPLSIGRGTADNGVKGAST